MSLSDAVDPLGAAPPVDTPSEWPQVRRKFKDRVWLHVALFLFTVGTTTIAGANHYYGFLTDFVNFSIGLSAGQLLLRGLWYSCTILAILGTHELGHYLACRYYRVDASLPFFLPVPLLWTGTLGAFIRIREPIPSKRVLFDIGVAGPIAGFLVAVPALLIGLSLSHVVRLPDKFEMDVVSLGEPLIFRGASWLIFGTPPDGYSLNMHPMAFGAWFGLLATALNLIPIGQLDGGHISYAVLGRRSTIVTLASILTALVLTYFSMSWLVWTVLMMVMLFAYGPHHPRTVDEHVPLDPARKWLAFAALVILVLCFTPVPLEPLQMLGK
jgi:membrane-associated protease RseP (regulator of RpoE activity)